MRTHFCGEINLQNTNEEEVTICGWVQNKRDHGGLIFIDLTDDSGVSQVVIDPTDKEVFSYAEKLRNAFVVKITGTVRARPEGTTNNQIKTGSVEIAANRISILNSASPLPFQSDETDLGEQTRLKYRFLDLRRPQMKKNLKVRHQVNRILRGFLEEHRFIEIETPILTKSTPEGARDYLVPSRTNPGSFFALPQSPQLFKQILMISGFDRYFQFARCFRDEDLRADRQPEFTQLDIELSFSTQEEIMSLMEEMIKSLFLVVSNNRLPAVFKRITYTQAMALYGTDRPDLRNPLCFQELTDIMANVDFKVFYDVAHSNNGRIVAMHIPDGGVKLSRAKIDDYTTFVKRYGAKGLAYIKVNDVSKGRSGLQSPILKFLPDDVLSLIIKRCEAKSGGLIFFGADQADVVNSSLSALRDQIGKDLNLLSDGWEPIWVTDFPLLEWNEEQNRWNSLHHPFTAPKTEDIHKLDESPNQVLSQAYDLVLNGAEIGGGSIRIHNSKLQGKVLKLLGIEEQEARDKFDFLLDALEYGAPPHGGIAFGIDRLVSMIVGAESIRDVIAFPKTQKASCLLTNAPSHIDPKQMKELGLAHIKKPITKS